MSLNYFVVVARECSVNRAARILHTSQSAVSRRLQQLEHDAGVRLFERRASGVTLTCSGRALLRYVEEIRRLTDEALHVIKEVSGEPSQPVHIGYCVAATVGLFPLLRMLQAAHPEVEVKVTELTRAAVLEALHSNKIDLALPGHVRPDLLEKVNGVRIPSPAYDYVLPDRHHFARRRRLHLAEMKDEKFVSLEETEFPGYNAVFLELCRKAGFVPHISTFAHSWTEAIAYVITGSGITIAPQSVIALPLAATITLVHADIHTDWYAMWNPSNGNPQLRTVIRLLQEASPTSWITMKRTLPALGSSCIPSMGIAKTNSPSDG